MSWHEEHFLHHTYAEHCIIEFQSYGHNKKHTISWTFYIGNSGVTSHALLSTVLYVPFWYMLCHALVLCP